MKKQLLTVLFMAISVFAFAQEETQKETTKLKQNEFKLNVTNFIIFKFLDVGYERVLNEESTVGINLLTNTDSNNIADFDYYRTFSLTPYYRHFFGKKYARGFFVEGFAMYHTRKSDGYDYYNAATDTYIYVGEEHKVNNFALGISTGAKFITKRNFVAEVYLGIGRNITSSRDYDNIVGRGGISLGWRF